MKEKVLAASLNVIKEVFGEFDGQLKYCDDTKLDALWPKCVFLDRDMAEESPEFKQIIPYCLIEQGDKVLTYTRGKVGQETRLHAKKSFGIGGHINPIDTGDNGREAFKVALLRELKEEVGINEGDIDNLDFYCVVNEDETEVGKVHIGLVYVASGDFSNMTFEDCLVNPEFLTSDQAIDNKDEYEKWSQILIEDEIRIYGEGN